MYIESNQTAIGIEAQCKLLESQFVVNLNQSMSLIQ